MTPSNVGSIAQSETGEGLDASRQILTRVDLSQMEAPDMVRHMTAEMEALGALFETAETRADVEGRLQQVELAGINYRTMILRVERALDQGDEATEEAWARGRARLRRAHADLTGTGDRLARTYPEIKDDVRERFDKFEFGLLARRGDARTAARTGRDERTPR